LEKIYELHGHQLTVRFSEKVVQLSDPKALRKFLSIDIDLRSNILVNTIKSDYLNIIGKELAIKNDSLVVEIWGHVFAGNLARAIKKLIRLKPIENAANFVIHRSDTIDCGENEVDSNRKIWDVMANFKGLILFFLPKRLKKPQQREG
jgi:hypothetical protein